MSNSLAIAAVTASLRSLLDQRINADPNVDPNSDPLLAGTQVTTRPPDRARSNNMSGNQLNLFLYQTVSNAAWRNMDMPQQVKPGETGSPPLPLNLYYLITAYGEDDDTDGVTSHRLLGRAMSVLHDHPLLGRQEVENALAESGLPEQIERLRITPQPLSLQELFNLWSTFQTPYRISAAYEVTVVLIESTRAARAPLPVLTRGKDDRGPIAQANLIPPFPTIERIDLPNRQISAQLNDQITLVGHHFALDTGDPSQVTMTVRFITTRLSQPISVTVPASQRTDTQITVTIPHQAGVFYPAGLYRVSTGVMPNGKPLEERVTNEFPLMIAPRLTQINGTNLPVPPAPPISVGRVNVVGNLGDATLNVTCNPDVLPEQAVSLLIGDRAIAAEAHAAQTNALTFVAKQITAGTFRLRLRVDGVDSPLIDRSNAARPKFDDSQQVTIT